MDHPAHGPGWVNSGSSSSAKPTPPKSQASIVNEIFHPGGSKTSSLKDKMKPKEKRSSQQEAVAPPSSGRPQATPKNPLNLVSRSKDNTSSAPTASKSSSGSSGSRPAPRPKASGSSARVATVSPDPEPVVARSRPKPKAKASKTSGIDIEVLVDTPRETSGKQRLSHRSDGGSSTRSSDLSDPPSSCSTPPPTSTGRDYAALTKGFVPRAPSPLQEEKVGKAKKARKQEAQARERRASKIHIPGMSEGGASQSVAEARTKEQERREDDERRMQEGKRMADQLEAQLAAWKQSEASNNEAPRSQRLPKDAKSLTTCPFCNEPLPDKPSKLLYSLIQSLLDQSRGGNKIASTSRLTACHRHRDERTTIPHGLAQGWPKKLDEAKLQTRARSEEIMSKLELRVRDPMTSTWFVEVREKEKVKRGAATGMANFADMQAGYFGEAGWMLLRSVITSHFLMGDPPPSHDLSLAGSRIAPLTAHSFIDTVMLPELVCLLIQQDKGCSVSEARKLKEDSSAYGIAMFPASLEEMESWGDDDSDGFTESVSQPAPSASRSERATKRRAPVHSGKPSATPIDISSSASQPRRPRPKAASNKSVIGTTTTEVIDLANSPPRAGPKPVACSSSGNGAAPASSPPAASLGSRPKPRARKTAPGPSPTKRSRMNALFSDGDDDMPLSQDSLPADPSIPLGGPSRSRSQMDVDDLSQDSLPADPSKPLGGPSASLDADTTMSSQESLPQTAWQPIGGSSRTFTTDAAWSPPGSLPIPSLPVSDSSPPSLPPAYRASVMAPFSDGEEDDDDDATAPLPSQGSSTSIVELSQPPPPPAAQTSSSSRLRVASQKDIRMRSVDSDEDELASTQESNAKSDASAKRKRTFDFTGSPDVKGAFGVARDPKDDSLGDTSISDGWDKSFGEAGDVY